MLRYPPKPKSKAVVQSVVSAGLQRLRQSLRGNSQVDLFFASVATAMGARAVGIVFSGYHGDGAEGCRRIKAAGGTTFAQDSSAEVSGMPLSAQATGCVDFVLSPDEIPAQLDKLITRFERASPKGLTTTQKRWTDVLGDRQCPRKLTAFGGFAQWG